MLKNASTKVSNVKDASFGNNCRRLYKNACRRFQLDLRFPKFCHLSALTRSFLTDKASDIFCHTWRLLLFLFKMWGSLTRLKHKKSLVRNRIRRKIWCKFHLPFIDCRILSSGVESPCKFVWFITKGKMLGFSEYVSYVSSRPNANLFQHMIRLFRDLKSPRF